MNLTNLQKMIFLYNAIESGWIVKKEGESYKFKKKNNENIENIENIEKLFIKDNLKVK